MADGGGGPGGGVDLDSVLHVAKEAALAAGELIRAAWPQKSAVKATKSNATDLVTETDQRCEEVITARIRKTFADHTFIGEESTGDDGYVLGDAPTWIIDPIDGTTNFVSRFPYTCVLISFAVNKVGALGTGDLRHAPRAACHQMLLQVATKSGELSRSALYRRIR